MYKQKRGWLIIVLLISSIGIILPFCGKPPIKKSQLINLYSYPAKDNIKFWNWHDSVRYVGAESCMPCHREEYTLYMRTGMGRSFDYATRKKSDGIFGKSFLAIDSFSDYRYKPFWQKDSLYLLEYRTDSLPISFKHIEKIDYVIGSGHHTNSHIFNINNYLFQIPITFYVQHDFWSNPPGFEQGFNSRYGRKIGLECLCCHNSYPDMVLGSDNKYTYVPQGITCERCHGPSSLHNLYMEKGIVVDKSKATDSTIVTPGKLTVELLNDLCTRCHLQGNAVLQPGKSFYDFKPGMKLSDVMSTFLPHYEGEAQFLMASHSPRFFMSKCYTESNKNPEINKQLRPYEHPDAMTCLTCHTPHTSVFDEKPNHFNEACMKCHDGKKHAFCGITQKLMDTYKYNCITCHMPTVTSIDIPHVTITDHYIRIPVTNKQKNKKPEFIKLYCAHNKTPDDYTMARAYLYQYEKFDHYQQYLDSAKKYLPDTSTATIKKNFNSLIYWAYLKQDYTQILDYTRVYSQSELTTQILINKSWDNEDAYTLYKIAEAYYYANNYYLASFYYKKAVELSPYIIEFQNKLAAACLKLGDIDQALYWYKNCLKENPKFVQALSNLGYIYLQNNEHNTANNYLNRALTLDPDYELAIGNKIRLLIEQNKLEKALQWAEHLYNNQKKQNKSTEKTELLIYQLKSQIP